MASVSDTTVTSARAGPAQARAAPRAPIRTELMQCLVVSHTAARRAMLCRAAASAGWISIECPDMNVAARHIDRSLVQLAVVDLGDGNCPSQNLVARSLVERLCRLKGVLVIVCGTAGGEDEESWARQLGVWLYLPGLTQANDVAVLCGEAYALQRRVGRSDIAVV